MPDNRQDVELAPIAHNPPLHSQRSFAENPQYGANGSGTEAKLARLREWQRIIYRHKWLILSIILVILPLATIQAYRAKPIYQATTTIDVRSENSSLSKTGNILLFESNDTKAEIFILKSLPIIKQTIADLNLDKNPRFLDVNKKRTVLEAIESLRGGSPERERKIGRRNANNTGAGEMKADDIESDPFPSEQAERKRLAPYVQTLLDNLSVEGMRDTRLIKISFKHTDPEIAAAVANGVASTFKQYNFDSKNERFNSASSWLEDSTRRLKAQVEKAEQNLVNYTRENNIISVEGKENL